MFSGRLDLRSSLTLARQNWSKLRSALASGRSSDFPQSALPSQHLVSGVIQADLKMRITAAGTVPDFHRIPLHQAVFYHQIAMIWGQRYNFLSIVGA